MKDWALETWDTEQMRSLMNLMFDSGYDETAERLADLPIQAANDLSRVLPLKDANEKDPRHYPEEALRFLAEGLQSFAPSSLAHVPS